MTMPSTFPFHLYLLMPLGGLKVFCFLFFVLNHPLAVKIQFKHYLVIFFHHPSVPIFVPANIFI